MALTLRERMFQVEDWLGCVAIRPLEEEDYVRAHTSPVSWKRAFDAFTYGGTYMVRHSRRNIRKGITVRGVLQALPVPLMALVTAVSFPISACFIQRLEQRRVRSEDATREDTIAFELWNARQVANKMSRDDQVRMLKEVHGMPRSDVVAWACSCIALGAKVMKDVEHGSERVRGSRLIQRQMRKTTASAIKLRELYR